MQTDVVVAAYVEPGDFLEAPDGSLEVHEIHDNGDFITMRVLDEEGEVEMLTFAPFDVVHVVTSFED